MVWLYKCLQLLCNFANLFLGIYLVTSVTYDLNSVSENNFKLNTGVDGKLYYTATFKLEIKLDTRLKFWASFDGKEMGSVEVSYE
jgi:hypothetical protein